MSRDIFIQDIPVGIVSVEAIPDGWMPEPLPFGHAEVVEAVRSLVPDADVSDPAWIRLEVPGVDVEVNVANKSPLESFALHIRASDRQAADVLIERLLQKLGARAFDSESESGIFNT